VTDLEGRFEQLERRVEQLETLLRQVLARTSGVSRVELAPERPRAKAPAAEPLDAPEPVAAPAPTIADLQISRKNIVTASLRPDFDLEVWVGRRGLLIVGVVALLATGTFFLEYAFQHHWIPPVVRSIISITAGIGVAIWGHTLIQRGMRRYGGPVVGAGGGLIYLGIWAAAGPFDLVDRRVGILALAVASTMFALLAQRYEIEGLAISALVGAFAAPLVLKTPVPNVQLFLGYTEVVAIGGGIVAYAMEWRLSMLIAIAGCLVLGALTLSFGRPVVLARPVGLSFLVLCALLSSDVSRRRPWWEVRLLAAFGVWLLFFLAMLDDTAHTQWLALGAMTLICGTFFVHLRLTKEFEKSADRRPEAVIYLLSPVMLTAYAAANPPKLLEDHLAVVPALCSLPYLVDGWARRAGHALLLGLGLLALAIPIEFTTLRSVMAWSMLAGLVAAAHAKEKHPGLRFGTMALYALAAATLLADLSPERFSRTHAFTDDWAFTLYAVLAIGVVIVSVWRQYQPPESNSRRMVWWFLGATALLGISINIVSYFDAIPGADLAGDLSLSVWWLLFAAGVVAVGFRRNDKVVRSAGLAVAVIAAGKVLLYDLSNLEALYRIGVFFVLAVIALGVAFAYHKQKNVEEERRGESSR